MKVDDKQGLVMNVTLNERDAQGQEPPRRASTTPWTRWFPSRPRPIFDAASMDWLDI